MKEFEEEFLLYVRKKSKEIVCSECGTYSLKPQKSEFVSPIEANVTLKCERCEVERRTNMTLLD